MKKLIVAAVFGSLVSVSAMASEVGPKILTGQEMDKVTAGQFQLNAASVQQTATAVAVNAGNFNFGGDQLNVAAASARNSVEQENEVD